MISSSSCDVGLFVVFVRRCFVRRLCAMLFVFLVSLRYLIGSDRHQLRSDADPINDFGVIHVADPETCCSRDLNIVICVDICTLPFYAINMDVVSLFTDSSFLFLANLHYIDVLYQFE